MRILRPKHTLGTVIESLAAGLSDGTIVIPRKEDQIVFPELEERTLEAIERSEDKGIKRELSKILPARFAGVQAPHAAVVACLTALLELASKCRQTRNPAFANDLTYYARRLKTDLEALHETREEAFHIVVAARKLGIAFREAPLVIDDLGIDLQLRIIGVLLDTYKKIQEALGAELYSTTTDIPVSHRLFQDLRTALETVAGARLEDLQLLAGTLVTASFHIRPDLHAGFRSTENRGISFPDRRDVHREGG